MNLLWQYVVNVITILKVLIMVMDTIFNVENVTMKKKNITGEKKYKKMKLLN